MSNGERFFWLHIKKSAGTSLRKFLAPHYVEADRSEWPECFTQVDEQFYNDLLNNYRIPLGRYQFKRALFAKTFLYPDKWDDMITFAIAREPVDRIVSMFHYLYWQKSNSTIGSLVRTSGAHRKIILSKRYAFDLFLDVLDASRGTSPYSGMGLHFNTHTALMADDIEDDDGARLIRHIYRLEDVAKGVKEVFDMCGIDSSDLGAMAVSNKSHKGSGYTLTVSQRRKVERIYQRDFDLYESL